MNTNDDLTDDWDALLSGGLVEPPAQFHARVMKQIQMQTPEPVSSPSLAGKTANVLQAAIVIVGAMAAGWQTLGFIFGLWATTLAL